LEVTEAFPAATPGALADRLAQRRRRQSKVICGPREARPLDDGREGLQLGNSDPRII
jgi:hypothetical protein